MMEKEKSEEVEICRILLKASEEWTEFCEKISSEILKEEKVGTLLSSYQESGNLEFLEFSLF